MSDESMEVTATETDVTETQSDKGSDVESTESKEVDTQEPSKTTDEVKKDVVEKEPTKAEKVQYAMQKRLDRQTAASKAYQEKMKVLEEQVKALTPEVVNIEPKQDDYKEYDEWQDAVVEHRASELFKSKELEYKQHQLRETQQVEHEKSVKIFQESELTFKADNPDYDEKANAFMDIANDLKQSKGEANPTLVAIGQVLMNVPDAPAIINHLGGNEELVYELAEMSPVNAAFKLFEIRQETLGNSLEIDKPKPKPIKSLKGNGKVNKSLVDADAKGVMDWVNS